MAIGNPFLCDPIMARQIDALVSDSDIDIDDDCDEGLNWLSRIVMSLNLEILNLKNWCY
jgi:hypothetical protein